MIHTLWIWFFLCPVRRIFLNTVITMLSFIISIGSPQASWLHPGYDNAPRNGVGLSSQRRKFLPLSNETTQIYLFVFLMWLLKKKENFTLFFLRRTKIGSPFLSLSFFTNFRTCFLISNYPALKISQLHFIRCNEPSQWERDVHQVLLRNSSVPNPNW